jgi:hypothetical protein
MRGAIIGALMIGAIGLATRADAEILRYQARLGAAVAPSAHAVGPTAVADFTLDIDSKILSWRIIYAGLSGPVLAARFKTPDLPGQAPGIPPPYASPIISAVSLSDFQIGDLRAGLWSLALATRRRPEGEITGPLERVK